MALFGPQPQPGNREPYWSRALSRSCAGCNVAAVVVGAVLLWVLWPLVRVFVKALEILFFGGAGKERAGVVALLWGYASDGRRGRLRARTSGSSALPKSTRPSRRRCCCEHHATLGPRTGTLLAALDRHRGVCYCVWYTDTSIVPPDRPAAPRRVFCMCAG